MKNLLVSDSAIAVMLAVLLGLLLYFFTGNHALGIGTAMVTAAVVFLALSWAGRHP